MKKSLNKIVIGALPLFFFLLCWEYYSTLSDRNTFLFASPSKVFISLINNTTNGLLLHDFYITSCETIIGFIIGNVLGSIIGLSLWLSKRSAIISRPYVIAIGAIPIFAVAPMMIMWFGTGIFAKIIMAALSTIIIAISQSYEGARNVDVNQINLLKSFGANKFQIFRKLIIPSSLIWVFNSLKLNVSFALLGAFIGEFISAEAGLGYRVLKAGGLYDVPLVLASIICMIVLVFFMTGIIRLTEINKMSWKEN